MNMFELELVLDSAALSRLPLSLLLLKTLVGPNCIGPLAVFDILPKFERYPALLLGREEPEATAQPSGPT